MKEKNVMDFFRKVVTSIKELWIGLLYGMKATEDVTLHQTGLDNGAEGGVHQQVKNNRVAQSLLKGEITEAVQELVYRTYKIEEESYNWEYYSPLYARKNMRAERTHSKYDDSDGRELITIQENFAYQDDAKSLEIMLQRYSVDEKNQPKNGTNAINLSFNKEGIHDYADMAVPKTYTISIERPIGVRFSLEKFITRVVVKKGDDEEHAVFDCYISKYAMPSDFKHKALLKEIKGLIEGMRSDITEMNVFEFITNKAYGISDAVKFEFHNIKYMSVNEYDGSYVLKFQGRLRFKDTPLSERHYSESMAKKYEENAPKEATITYDPDVDIRTYKCEECGKRISYNVSKIAEMDSDLADESAWSQDGGYVYKGNGGTDFMDTEVSIATFGKCLCSECLEKYLSDAYFKEKREK